MHASQIQGCIVEHRVEKKRKITESVWVHNVVTVRKCFGCNWLAKEQHRVACRPRTAAERIGVN